MHSGGFQAGEGLKGSRHSRTLHIHGGGSCTWIWNGDLGRWSRPTEKRTRTPTAKMEGKGEERRSIPGGHYSDGLELGGLDDDNRNRRGRGGREPLPSHDSNLRRIHAASHTGHGVKQSNLLVKSRYRGTENELRLGPKTVPEGAPLVSTRREKCLPALPSVSSATALVTKGDQDREE